MPPHHLAITMGDPAGIGPEIIVKAAARLRPQLEAGALRLLVIGSNPDGAWSFILGACRQGRAERLPQLLRAAGEGELRF